MPRRWPRLVRRWLVAVAAGFVGVAGVEIGMRMALGPPAVHFLTRPGRDADQFRRHLWGQWRRSQGHLPPCWDARAENCGHR